MKEASIKAWKRGPLAYAMVLIIISALTFIIQATHADANISNISMLYLLAVIVSALFFGSLPAIFASLLAFLCSDWFFIQPKYTLDVHDPSEWLTLCVSLITAIIAGQLMAQLQKRIEEQDKLMQAEAEKRALAEADKLKTALLSMVSHDFRSPLTSIKTSVNSLLQEGMPFDAETQKTLLQTVDQETDRLNRLVGNILDLSRLEAGAWRPKRELTSITELVGAALDSFNKEANERIRVSMNNLPEVQLDFVQMVQVLHNLIENALKYSTTEVELQAFQYHNNLVLSILDRGPGLPKGEEENIFLPF